MPFAFSIAESLNQDLTVADSWCLMKWLMWLTPKKTKSMVVSRFRTKASSYGYLTLSSAELEKLKRLRILSVTLDSKLTFETYLHEVVSKAARSLGVLRSA